MVWDPVERDGAHTRGVGRGGAQTQGSGEVEPVASGLGEAEIAHLGVGWSCRRALDCSVELMLMTISSSSSGTLVLVPDTNIGSAVEYSECGSVIALGI